MSDAKKSDVFYGADAIARLDPKKLGELAEASERGYVADEGELPKAIASWHERMRKVLEQGQVAVVTVGDDKEVVSMAGFRLIGKTSDGCPVYEAGSSVTLPEHQKKGYYRQAMERIVAEEFASGKYDLIHVQTLRVAQYAEGLTSCAKIIAQTRKMKK